MKKKLLILISIYFLLCKFSSAQIICVYCYNQNTPISTGINNLVLNGGFENGCNIGGRYCPNSSSYNCDITNWTCTGGGTSTYAQMFGSSFGVVVEGTKFVYFG